MDYIKGQIGLHRFGEWNQAYIAKLDDVTASIPPGQPKTLNMYFTRHAHHFVQVTDAAQGALLPDGAKFVWSVKRSSSRPGPSGGPEGPEGRREHGDKPGGSGSGGGAGSANAAECGDNI